MRGAHGRYRVAGLRSYRGHRPGAHFDAVLDPAAERRAIVRGDIALVERVVAAVQDGSYTFPVGWLEPGNRPTTRAGRRW